MAWRPGPPAADPQLSDREILWLRARAQRLTRESRHRSTPERILADVGGLQAQDLDAAALGLRARSTGLRRSDVDVALREKRSVVRTWLMRGTLHLVAAEDVRWLLAVMGPVFAAGNKARHAQLGLTDELKSRGLRAIRRILAEHGPLTRYELVDQLRRLGIDLKANTQAPIHLIAFAAFNAVCCLGPDRRTRQPTYVLLDDWVKPGPTPSRPLGELARRYFSAYGPASLDDFGAWSGLKVAQLRTALEESLEDLEQVTFRGLTLFLPKGRRTKWKATAAPRQDARLLPAFDTYLLGYRSRDLAANPALQKRLHRGGGWLHPAVVIDGRAIGAWSIRRRQEIEAEISGPISADVRKRLGLEVTDIGRFLGRNLRLRLG